MTAFGNNIETPWTFRDGRENVVTLSTSDNPRSVSLRITDKITAEEWTCNYDAKCKSRNAHFLFTLFVRFDWRLIHSTTR